MLYNSNKRSQLPLFSRPLCGAGDFHSAALMHPLSEIRIRASLYLLSNPHQQQSQRQRTKKPTCQEVGNLESWKAKKPATQAVSIGVELGFFQDLWHTGVRILFRSRGILSRLWFAATKHNRA